MFDDLKVRVYSSIVESWSTLGSFSLKTTVEFKSSIVFFFFFFFVFSSSQ